VVFKQVLQFFVTLEIDLLKEASLASAIEHFNLKNKSYDEIVTTIFGLLEPEWVRIIGANGSKIYASLQRKSTSMTLETYLGAVKHLGFGFGVRKAKALLRGLDSPSDVWKLTVSEIEQIEGFDSTAPAIVDGLPKAKALLDELGIQTVIQQTTSELAGLNVVFTGFRDKEFQDRLERAGAKVGTGVSKKTTHVLTVEPNSNTAKAIKARELGITTMSLDEFKDAYHL
jgi:NAD-dependent DNA ligase